MRTARVGARTERVLRLTPRCGRTTVSRRRVDSPDTASNDARRRRIIGGRFDSLEEVCDGNVRTHLGGFPHR